MGDKYVIYGRDQATETKLEIFNIWGDGSYRWQNREIFPIRMSNLNGRKIKATSFDYKPFCYPVDGVYQGYEVIRSKKCTRKDFERVNGTRFYDSKTN